MFTKLLKQEWRATRGILGLLCLVSLIAAVLGGGSMRFLVGMSQETEEMEGIIVLCAMILACAIIAIAVCCAASVFLMIWRFYRSRFTDEGYLTFTLPVNSLPTTPGTSLLIISFDLPSTRRFSTLSFSSPKSL